jgi:DNA polymerase-4
MATETLILHSDLNCYYASVEMNEHPELRGKKVAVCGSTENRHGIVLTASYPAKRSGVKTGMATGGLNSMSRPDYGRSPLRPLPSI